LSAEGNLDWAHWGLDQTNLFNHRDGVIPQISNFSVLGTNSFARSATNSNLFAWTNGTPSLSVSNTAAGALVTGLSNGFAITVPADTRQRLLKLYLGATFAQGQIQATLSDLSAPDLLDFPLDSSGPTLHAAYTFHYAADS